MIAAEGMRWKCKTWMAAIAILVSVVVAHGVSARSVGSLGRPTGYVNDYTNTLSSSELSRLEAIASELEQANSTEMAIVIVDSTDGRSIEDYAQELFMSWGIGKRGADNGLLVLVAIEDRAWRVHTGYGIEGVLPDTLAARIMREEAVPEFREGDFGEGLIRAATAFKRVLEGQEYAVQADGLIWLWLLVPLAIPTLLGVLIWLAVRVLCPRCGSRVKLLEVRKPLEATYDHSGLLVRDYECTVCHHRFSRMQTIPRLVESTSSGYASSGGFRSGGFSSGGFSSGGGSFGGFGGGRSGGGGASGGW